MSRAAVLVLAFAASMVVLAAGGAVVQAWPTARAWVDAAPAAGPARPAASAPRAQPRTERRFTLDEAMRELDLIRPPRSRPAHPFSAPLLSGKRFRLADHRGRVVLVNFWATWCLPCREEMPSMERLWRQHRDTRLMLVAVSLDGDAQLAGAFVAEHRLTFPVVIDSRYEIANLYGVRALPASFVVDPRGNLAALALGPRTWDNDAAHSLVEGLAK